MARAGLPYAAAEAQGIACGLLCAAIDADASWASEVYADFDPADALAGECRTLLDGLLHWTRAGLRDDAAQLQLVLPDGSAQQRGAALCDWSQGFLFGFGLGGREVMACLSPQGAEALRDIAEIAQLAIAGIAGGEEDEQSLMELEEYLRVVAMLIHDEVAAADGSSA